MAVFPYVNIFFSDLILILFFGRKFKCCPNVQFLKFLFQNARVQIYTFSNAYFSKGKLKCPDRFLQHLDVKIVIVKVWIRMLK